jgi:hypothetical protein
MTNVSDKSCRENQNTNFIFTNFFENRAVYEIMWKKYGRAGLATDDNVGDALSGRLTKATNTHAEYGILICFPRQQWLHKLQGN